jgi:plastocyanin
MVDGELRGRGTMMSGRAAVALALASAIASSFVGSTRLAEAAERSTHTVVIDGLKYDPESIAVHVGDSIVWVNKDPFPHTVTAAGAFDSGSIAAGKSWKYIARKRGDYRYICTLHPNMSGTLKVE